MNRRHRRSDSYSASNENFVLVTLLAAERRKNVATAESRGLDFDRNEPRSGERFFRRYAAHSQFTRHHGLRPWLHSHAAPRLGYQFGAHVLPRPVFPFCAKYSLTSFRMNSDFANPQRK